MYIYTYIQYTLTHTVPHFAQDITKHLAAVRKYIYD